MQHPNFETRHPLQAEDHETGVDPLQNFNRTRPRGSLESSGSVPFTPSESTFLSYRKEWDELFLDSNYLARIRPAGTNGRLRSSRYQSVCWKLYLDILPEDKNQWINKTKELRAQYERIKETHITNPRKAAGHQDLMVNNPLSQDEGSLWNKFFQDKELRGMIRQDVLRTFPEMQYFQQEDVRAKLTDILFCYARENEQLLYKQGMHELLAPIVFVLHCDHQAFQHASETASPSEEMKSLLNPEFHEHDAYAMFSQLMETAEPWFSSFEREVRKGKEEMMTSIPFARPQDAGPSVAIVTKVNRIQDQLVKRHDIELHMHLNRLEIAPQIYGIRWVRLLFGREFPLQDLLVVWDALFADSLTLDLVDYVFVAMLLYIRDALIASNFQTCLGLLMHYPPIGDVHSLLQKALFLRDPKNNPRPVNYQFQQNLEYYKTRGADHMSKTRANSSPPRSTSTACPAVCSASAGNSSPHHPGSAQCHRSNQQPGGVARPLWPAPWSLRPRPAPPPSQPSAASRMMKSESMPVHLTADVGSAGGLQVSHPAPSRADIQGPRSRAASSSTSTESLPGGRDLPSSPPLCASRKDSFFNIPRSHSKGLGRREAEEELEAQVSFLQGQLNDLEAMCKFCAKMMNVHIGKIQEVILQENLDKEDEVLVSLAGLKQIKDILKGSLRFNQSQLEAEENEEITIADDHYCSTAQQGLERNGLQDEAETDCLQPLPDPQIALPDPQVALPDPQVLGALGSEGRSWDDYILVSQDDDTPPQREENRAGPPQGGGAGRGRGAEQEGLFQDPLTGGVASESGGGARGSSPEDDGKDSDFTMVTPADL
ncbi:LOW QUALITY PROTEIN: TBC1 domain family member 5 [Conger conger]|uniref:LOW QUALITY PROTEIN: TBC1 domain family member 5 n=1 Tax=Conger conger TaxID=82655 RepID=UPI002A5A2991|nr:LOW QUALITY PROTEIN: TBC1 domain family member 5 [Conger conger]